MKINAEKFIEKYQGNDLASNFFLITGNEIGLIHEIEKIIIQKIKLIGFNEVVKVEEEKIQSIDDLIDRNTSLFTSSKIYLHKNPKEINIQDWDNIDSSTSTIIVSSNKIKNNSKIKSYFDNHKKFYSVSCYKISRQFKKKIIDRFLNLNKITIKKTAYWYLLESSENEYPLLINELEKIKQYDKKELETKEIQLLLSPCQSYDLENLFFHTVLSSNAIIQNSRSMIRSLSDSYFFIQRVKYFIDLLTKANTIFLEENDMEKASSSLPKYLFREKDKLNLMIRKLNQPRIIVINNIIKKTEILLRKNNSMYLIIVQRFLLNLRKNLV